jgi:hypothetical protein
MMIQHRCWEEAERVLEEGLAVAQSMPDAQVEARLLEMWGLLHAQKGEVERARERLAAALDIFRRRGAHKDARRVERALADLPRGVRAQRATRGPAQNHMLRCTLSERWRYVYPLSAFQYPSQQQGQAIPAERQQIPA